MGRRQEMQGQRHAPAGDGGMGGQAEQFLHADGERRAALGLVVERDGVARWRGEMGRRLRLEPPRHVPWQKGAQGLPEIVGADVGERRLAIEIGRQPVANGRRQRRVGEVWPFLALGPPEEHDAVAPLAQRLRPWQAIEAERGDALGEQDRRRRAGRRRQHPFGERQRADAPDTAGAQGGGGAFEGGFLAGLERVAGRGLDLLQRQGRGGQNPRGGGPARDLRDGEKGFARQPLMRLQNGRAPVRHQELAGLAARLRHAVGIGQRDQGARAHVGGGGLDPRALRRHPRPAARQPPGVLGATRAVARKAIHPVNQIDRVAAKAPLDQRHGEFGRQRRGAPSRGVDNHAGEARRQRQGADGATLIRDGAIAIERAQTLQQRARLLDGRRGRRIEPGERRRIARAPGGEVEDEAGKIGGENFRRGKGVERAGRGLLPQAIADAGLGASRAAAALVGGGARHADRLQPRQADVGLIARRAGQAAVDHHPDALDGERGLGDGCRQHDLPPSRRGGRHGEILRAAIHRAKQRRDIDGVVANVLAQTLGDAQDFALTRQEHEQ